MIFSRKLLQYMEFTSLEDEGAVVVSRDDTSQLMEEEVQQLIAKLSTLEPASDEYGKTCDRIKVLSESIEKHDKNIVERQKVILQIKEMEQRRMINWDIIIPKLISIGAYALVTCVVIALERQTPLSMRWLRALDVLLAPKGI